MKGEPMEMPVSLVEVGGQGVADALAAALARRRLEVRRLRVPPDGARVAQDDGTLVIVVADRAPWRELLALQTALAAARRASVFVTVEAAAIVRGSLSVPGLTACLECRARHSLAAAADGAAALETLAGGLTHGAHGFDGDFVQAAARYIAADLAAALRGEAAPATYCAAHLYAVDRSEAFAVLPHAECAACAVEGPAVGPCAPAARAALARALEREGFDAELAYSPAPAPHPDRYRTVGIVGGGTAGYLTALALRRRLPELEVTLIESSRIPIIRVGEATTPDLVRFLHAPGLLGLDIVDLHRRVRPSFKLGIQFLWGATPDSRFSYPFQYAPLVDGMVHDGHLDHQSVASQLMYLDRAPLLDAGDGRAHSLLDAVRFAYHLDNERFVAYLREEVARVGVRHRDSEIRTAVVTPDGTHVDHLMTTDGERLAFDLYVDASGFRSLLLEGALGSPFESFGTSLFTDRALAASVPHDGTVRPYTRATSFDAGWCWTIPFEEADHIGYVYASAFLDDDAAAAEMRRRVPGMGEPFQVRFRSGRHRHFFTGNVVAVGNAYGFVEPLESTALHMLIYELEHLTNHFPLRSDTAGKARLSAKLNGLWDELRWFLSIHYRFNRRLDTPFWRAARADTDISGARARLELFNERAPLSDRPSLFYSVIPPDFFSGDHAFDTLLLGQGVTGRLGAPRMDARNWRHRARLRGDIARHALPVATALSLLRDRQPELLSDFIQAPTSWVHQWIAR